MDIYELISKVQINPPIWDRRIKEYSNRTIVDACWKRISLEMKVDGPVLRKKWKYLRDQFSVEYSKIKQSSSVDSAETTSVPKWPFFKGMIFLKDVIKPRASTSILKKTTPATEDGEDDVKVEESIGIYSQENEEFDSHVSRREAETSADNVDKDFPATSNMPSQTSTGTYVSRKRKRFLANSAYNEKILLQQQQQLNKMLSAFQKESENDDLMFFKSLLPFISKIPPEKKLRFRTRIQQVVDEFAFPMDNLHQK